jgi:hypothetical protein
MHVDKIGYHFHEVNLLHGGWVRYGRWANVQTFKNLNEVESSHIVPLVLKLKEYFLSLHLVIPMPQKSLNSVKEWERHGVFDVKVFNVWQ